MKLFYSEASPYARKCRVVAIEKQLDDRIETITAAPLENPQELRAANPLGKVPALILDDGTSFCDSPLICEYFDTIGDGPVLIPVSGPARWQILRIHALGDGILDAAVATMMEKRARPENEQSPKWIERWAMAVDAGLATLEKEVPSFTDTPDLGQITVGCALGYLDLRFDDLDWRSKFPKLAAWYEAFSKRSSMVTTKVG